MGNIRRLENPTDGTGAADDARRLAEARVAFGRLDGALAWLSGVGEGGTYRPGCQCTACEPVADGIVELAGALGMVARSVVAADDDAGADDE